MSDALLDFKWSVAAEYEWLTAVPDEGPTPYLVEKISKPRATYHPLDRDHAALFRTLAETPPTREGVMAFAQQYGFLTLPRDIDGRLLPHGELLEGPIDSWTEQIRSIRIATRLLDALASDDVPVLQSLLTQRERMLIELKGPSDGRYDNVRTVIKNVLVQLVQRKLDKFIGARLIIDDAPGQPLRLLFAPHTLLGALWLQVAMAATERKQYPNCKNCGRPFEVGRDQKTGFRKNREFCSGKCKSADYRERRRLATQLISRDIKASVIAQRTNTDIDTITEWMAARKANKSAVTRARTKKKR